MSKTGQNPQASQSSGIGGFTWTPQVTPPVTINSAYSSGQVIGGMLTFGNALRASSGVISNITIVDKDAQASALNIYIFGAAPATSYPDKSVFTMNATDAANCIGAYSILSGSSGWVQGGGVSVATISPLALAVASDIQKTLWMLIVSAGTPTFTSASAMITTMGILQD